MIVYIPRCFSEFDTMRKLTIEMEPDKLFTEAMSSVFLKVHSYEILETLKISYDEGICVDLIEVVLKPGITIQDVKSIDKMEIISVIRSDGNKHTCLAKYFETEENMDKFQETDLDLINSTPTIVSENSLTVSMIGENENLNKFVEMIKRNGGKIINMTIKRSAYQRQDLLSVLTEKQRNILITAHKHGYYDYPKKINSQQLSDKVDIGKATLVQHLRKAEGRLMGEILAGYS
jgi:predicted DNA binding protein